MTKILRVFPQRTSHTPDDDLAFIGDPPLFRPEVDEVHVSCTFLYDKPEAERLADAWSKYYPEVKLGGPAYDDPGGEFVPGRYIKTGYTTTSRGCPRRCSFCFVPKREGNIRTLKIHPGRVIQDNNLLACPDEHVAAVFEMLSTQRRIIFSGGVDARALKEWHVDWFKKHDTRIKEFWFASDGPGVVAEPLKRAARLMAGFTRRKKRCYVLIGHRNESPESAEERLRKVWMAGFLPFAIFYKGEGEQRKTPRWETIQRNWSRPALTKALMEGTPW